MTTPSKQNVSTNHDKKVVYDILNALNAVLRQACVQGVTLEQSFRHFERTQQNIVGVDDFMEAFTELKLLPSSYMWREDHIETCIYHISKQRSAAYFTLQDFRHFFGNYDKQNVNSLLTHDKIRLTENEIKSRAINILQIAKESDSLKRKESIKQSADPKLHVSKKREKKKPLLPDWAHQRSKRALEELEKLNKRRRKIKKPQCVGSEASIKADSDFGQQLSASQDINLEPISESVDGSDFNEASLNIIAESKKLKIDEHECLNFDLSSKWQTYQVDNSTTISYTILTSSPIDNDVHKMQTTCRKHTYGSEISPMKYGHQGVDNDVDVDNSSFRFTVFMDIFQQLETLEAFFAPFINKYSRGKVLIFGFPSQLSGNTTITSKWLSIVYAKLLIYLSTCSGKWLIQPKLGVGAIPQYLLAFGTGCNVAFQFLGHAIPFLMKQNAILETFLYAQRGLIVINPFVQLDRVVQNRFAHWLSMLSTERNSTEINESLLMDLFSNYYLAQVAISRQEALKDFFTTRPNSFAIRNSPNNFLVRQLFGGLLKSKNIDLCLTNIQGLVNIPFGTIVVHGTQNRLFSSHHVDCLKKYYSFLPDQAADKDFDEIKSSIEACMSIEADCPKFMVCWLKCGHEVLQERRRFCCNLMRMLVRVSCDKHDFNCSKLVIGRDLCAEIIGNDSSHVLESHNECLDTNTTVPEVFLAQPTEHDESNDKCASMVSTAKKDPSDNNCGDSLDEYVTDVVTRYGIKWIQQYLYDRGLEGSGTTESILEKYKNEILVEKRATLSRNEYAAITTKRHEEFTIVHEQKIRQNAILENEIIKGETAKRRQDNMKQKEFFKQMEARKFDQAYRQREIQSMSMEDILSKKFRIDLLNEESRCTINAQMCQNIRDLKFARAFDKHLQEQVRCQKERLAQQAANRENMKNYHIEFERKVLSSHSIESYMMHLTQSWDNFETISSGARSLVADLLHFQNLKKQHVINVQEQTNNVSKLSKELESEELDLRNAQRVLEKARATGAIAIAGLGAVRMIPVSSSGMGDLIHKVNVARDKVEFIRRNISECHENIAWHDQLIQKLNVLINRNNNFRLNVIGIIESCISKAYERLQMLREEEEMLVENQKVLSVDKIHLEKKHDVLCIEIGVVKKCKTELIDTNMRVAGSLQRVQRRQWLIELEEIINAVEKKLDDIKINILEIGSAIIENTLVVKSHVNIVSHLKHSLGVLNGITILTKEVDINQSTREITENQLTRCDKPSANSNLNQALSSGVSTSLADTVRYKLHCDRTTEEKHWVSIDIQLNPDCYYGKVEQSEIDIIKENLEYHSSEVRLKKDQISRLLSLPSRINLALAYLHCSEEIYVHYLLRKFSFEDDEKRLADQDDQFSAQESPSETFVVYQLEAVPNALERISSRSLWEMETTQRFNSRTELYTSTKGQQVLYCESHVPIQLLKENHCELQAQCTHTHTFQLPSNGVGILNLTISILFRGRFTSTGYKNGRLAGMLYMISNSQQNQKQEDKSDKSTTLVQPITLGKCFHKSDVELCTSSSLGKLMIHHSPNKKPLLMDATYQVVIGAPVWTSYSIEVVGQQATFADHLLQNKRKAAVEIQQSLPSLKEKQKNVQITLQLSQRKKRLALSLTKEAQDLALQAETQLIVTSERLSQDFASNMHDPISSQGNQQSLASLERKHLNCEANHIEEVFTQNSFLFSHRQQEVQDIEQGIQELTRINIDLLTEIEKKEKELDLYRCTLPCIAALLECDKSRQHLAGVLLARELNTDYIHKGKKFEYLDGVEINTELAAISALITPAEQLRKKYQRGNTQLNKKERQWIILDRTLHPEHYIWEKSRTPQDQAKLNLSNTQPKLNKEEDNLALLSAMEINRICKAPWNLLERKEIVVRKIMMAFPDDSSNNSKYREKQSVSHFDENMALRNLMRSKPENELTREESDWREYDKVLNPHYYQTSHNCSVGQAAKLYAQRHVNMGEDPDFTIACATREELIAALQIANDDAVKLPEYVSKGRQLLLKYDPGLRTYLSPSVEKGIDDVRGSENSLELDIDARCRQIYHEIQRVIATTQNEFIDSNILNGTIQRFPTKVLRLELEKELDRVLVSQIREREVEQLKIFRKSRRTIPTLPVESQQHRGIVDHPSDTDSDLEAEIIRTKLNQPAKHNSGKKSAKMQGKSSTTKIIQKQHRDIKAALQPRTLEEQRTILQELELGVGGCMACIANPCRWKPYLGDSYQEIQARIEAINNELDNVKSCTTSTMTSMLCLAAIRSGGQPLTLTRADLFDELTAELKIWKKNMRLRAVDEEFHNTFNTKSDYFETSALHGFKQSQKKKKVQIALKREHDTLVAQLISHEMVEDMLEFMLEGWIFGECKSKRQDLGYVTSIKHQRPSTLHYLRLSEQQINVSNNSRPFSLDISIQGAPLDKWMPIEVKANQVNFNMKAVRKGSSLDNQLTETENAIKFGLFCMTLMYFRGLSLLKKQRVCWSKSQGRIGSPAPIISRDREKMQQQNRNIELRKKESALYTQKAKAGQSRKERHRLQTAEAYRRRLKLEHKKTKQETKAAQLIQKVYRGMIGRLAGRKWMLRRRELNSERAIEIAAAIMLQRCYRGRLGRIKADERRVELAEFISEIRAEEGIEEEREYWEHHKLNREFRKTKAFLNKEA